MALELFGGAILEAVFGKLQREISRVKDNVVMFKPKLEEIEETLAMLYPVIKEIEELNGRLNRPNHGTETIVLKRLLEEGAKLVSECSKIPRWNLRKQSRYMEKLMKLDIKILRFHGLYMQAHMGRDQKQTLLLVQETKQMLFMSLNQQGSSSNPTLSSMLLNQQGSSSNPTLSSMLLNQQGSSSNPTMSFTNFSADFYYKQKIVMKVDMDSTKCRTKALTVVASTDGVDFVGLDDREKVLVIGGEVDAVNMVIRLRKIAYAEILWALPA